MFHSQTRPDESAAAHGVPAAAEADREHVPGRAGQRGDQPRVGGIGQVPHPHGSVVCGAGQDIPAGTERHEFHRVAPGPGQFTI